MLRENNKNKKKNHQRLSTASKPIYTINDSRESNANFKLRHMMSITNILTEGENVK